MKELFPEAIYEKLLQENVIGVMDAMKVQRGKIKIGITHTAPQPHAGRPTFVFARSFGTKPSDREYLYISFDDSGDFTFTHEPPTKR